MKKFSLLIVLFFSVCQVFSQKTYYLNEIKKAAEKGWADNAGVIERWKKTTKPSVLWGYDAPAHPVYLASTLAFLYEETHDTSYARKAAELLASYGDLRNILTKEYAKTRAEYSDGVPSLPNFFFHAPYVRAYMRIRNSGVMDAITKARVEREISGSVDFVFRFPEWGGHNRAMLRAEALTYAYHAMPDHPHAGRWKQMADVLADDNVGHWEVEDAANYHPVWLLALFSYAEAADRQEAYHSAMIRYYLEYYTKLIAPSGTVPDFGDGSWNSASGALRFVAIFEKGAALFKNPEMKWAAQSVLRSVTERTDTLGVGDAYSLTDAYRWADESVKASRPGSLSQEVLDDLIGKKFVFRNGWADTSLYCLVNYRDEGDGGWTDREFLRQTLSVEEEKMHHGHADENSIVLLMNKGSVLLHDGGYRSDLPSGPYGAWRQDYFHNRIVARANKRDNHQTVLEFVRNSGAYLQVRTQKIDFLNLRDVDMSRSRLIDDELGYQWDRVITYVRDPGCFIVVDGIRILRSGFRTFSNFWHAQNIFVRGEHFVDVATDSVPGFRFPQQQSLLIYFPEVYAKTEGVESESRHSQTEQAIYQTISSQYKPGDMEMFVTILVPHDRSVKPGELLSKFKLLNTSAPFKAVGIEISEGGKKSTMCVKLDLEMEVARENIRPRYLYDLGKVQYGDFETDAHFLYATIDGKSLAYSADNVLRVLHKGKVLMEALPNTFGLQLDGAPDRVGYSRWRCWQDSLALPK